MNILTIILSLIPGFAWLFFYLREDPHPEPKRLIVFTFVVGMAFAFLALAIEVVMNSALHGFGVEKLTIFSLLCLALIEEFLKFWAAYWSIGKSPEFNEPVDAMIYMVVAALGFATVENLGAIGGIKSAETAILSSVFVTTSLRFVGATLLHSLASAVFGYYWALGIREFKAKRYIFIGIIVATLLHAFFNYLIINYGNLAYSVVFLAIVGFFVLSDFEKLKRRVI